MSAFRDTGGRTWDLKVTLATISRVHAECGIDLTQIFDRESAAAKAVSSAPVFFGVLCAALRPQLESRSVSEMEFGEALDEQASESAVLALHEGLISFFPESKRRVIEPAFRKVMAAARKVQGARLEQAQQTLESLDFEKVVSVAMDGRDSAGSLQASSASNPTTELSANSS